MSQVLTKAVAVPSAVMDGTPEAGTSSLFMPKATPDRSTPASSRQPSQHQYHERSISPSKSPSTSFASARASAASPVFASPDRSSAVVSLTVSKRSPLLGSSRPSVPQGPSAGPSRPLSVVQARPQAIPSSSSPSFGRPVATPEPSTSWLKLEPSTPAQTTIRREYVDLTKDDDGPFVDLTQDEPVQGIAVRDPSGSPAKPPPTAKQKLGPRYVPPSRPEILPPSDEPRIRSSLSKEYGDDAPWQSSLRLQKQPKNEGAKRGRLKCDWAIKRSVYSPKEYREAVLCQRSFATAEALFRHVSRHLRAAKNAAWRAWPHSAKIGCQYADCASSLKTWFPDGHIRRHVAESHFAVHCFACPYDSCRLSSQTQGHILSASALQQHIQKYHDESDPLRPLMAPVKPAKKLAPPPPLPRAPVPWHRVSMPDRIKVVRTDWRPAPHVPKAAAEGVLAEPAAPAEPGVQPWPKLIQMWTHLEPPAIPLQVDRSKTQKLEAVYIDAPRGPPPHDREPSDFSKVELARMRRGQPPVKKLRLSKLIGREEVAYVDIEPPEHEAKKPTLRDIPVFPRNFKLATPPPPREIPDMPEWSESDNDDSDEEMESASPDVEPVEKPWMVGEDAAASTPPVPAQSKVKTVWSTLAPLPGRRTLNRETIQQRRRDATRRQRPGPMASVQRGRTLVVPEASDSDPNVGEYTERGEDTDVAGVTQRSDVPSSTSQSTFDSLSPAPSVTLSFTPQAPPTPIIESMPSISKPVASSIPMLKQSSLTSFFGPPSRAEPPPSSFSVPKEDPGDASQAASSGPLPTVPSTDLPSQTRSNAPVSS